MEDSCFKLPQRVFASTSTWISIGRGDCKDIERNFSTKTARPACSKASTDLKVLLELRLVSEGYLGVLEGVDDVVHLGINQNQTARAKGYTRELS